MNGLLLEMKHPEEDIFQHKKAYLNARGKALNNGLSITVYSPNGEIKAVINPKL